jgi:hypothetical protein
MRSMFVHFSHEESKAFFVKIAKECREGAPQILKREMITIFDLIVKWAP